MKTCSSCKKEKDETKKEFYKNMPTIYGRNAVEEALFDNSLTIHKLHLAASPYEIRSKTELRHTKIKSKIII